MKFKDKKEKVSFFTCVLLSIVGILICAEALHHTTTQAEEPKKEDVVPFDISNVDNIKSNPYEGYCEFTYYVDSIESNVVVSTSIIEGDYLQVYMDCLELYSYNNSYEDIDRLQSYLLNNSKLKYVDNQWYQGWIWIYDACPIYRFPHP